MNVKKDKVLLVDGLNFIHRANIIFKPSTDSDKQQPEELVVVYNFFRNLRALVETFNPTKIFFVLEGKPQFRYDLYPEYKATRKLIKTGEKQSSLERVFKAQTEILRLLKYLPITIVKAENYECDDVIASLAGNMQDEEIIIISNDSDYIQLLQKGYKNIKIYNPMKKEYRVAPEVNYIAAKSLMGDKSDNIAGVCKPSKANELLNDPVKFEQFLSLEENRSKFAINMKLIEFAEVSMDDLIIENGVENFPDLKLEFEKLEFNSMLTDKYWNTFVNTFANIKY